MKGVECVNINGITIINISFNGLYLHSVDTFILNHLTATILLWQFKNLAEHKHQS